MRFYEKVKNVKNVYTSMKWANWVCVCVVGWWW